MAYTSSFFVLSLCIGLFFAATNTLAQGLLGGLANSGLNVGGVLCCTSTGNCPGQGVGGVSVSLNCTNILGITNTVAQTTTNPNGTFNLIAPSSSVLGINLPIVGGLLPCVVVVKAPILSSVVCPALSTVNTTLTSAVQLLGPLIGGLTGLINAIAIGFTLTA